MRGRFHSREFKLELVRQVVAGEKQPAQVCREHRLAEGLLLRWRKEYTERGEMAFTTAGISDVELLRRQVAELERFCGQLALENQALKKGSRALGLRSGMR
jgi:transposase